jgi:hypothetical protein
MPQAAPPPAAAAPTVPGAPSPAKIRAAQEYAALLTFMHKTIPPDVAATATYGLDIAKAAGTAQATAPTEINKAIAIAQGTLPSQLTLEAQKAKDTAQWQLWVKQNEPQLFRPNTLSIDQSTGRVIGGYEKIAPDGTMHRYVALPSGETKDFGQSAITSYATEGGKANAEKNQADAATVNKDAAAAAASRDQATSMRTEAKSFYTGFGSAYNQELNKVLLAIHPDNPELANKVASYETFIKDAGLWARQQAAATSARTGVQELKMVASSSPTEETSPRGLDRVLGQIQGLSDYRLAKQQAMSAYVNQPGRGGWDNNGFEAQFNANVSPYAYMYMRQSDEDKAELRATLMKTKQGQMELQRLQGQIKFIGSHPEFQPQ